VNVGLKIAIVDFAAMCAEVGPKRVKKKKKKKTFPQFLFWWTQSGLGSLENMS
jgi:hypothetical protein